MNTILDIVNAALKAHKQLMNTKGKQNNGSRQSVARQVFLCLTTHQNFHCAPPMTPFQVHLAGCTSRLPQLLSKSNLGS